MMFKLYENHERLHDLTSLYAILFQLPLNFSYEKLISEANIINYDYITDTFTLTFSKSLKSP